MQLMIRDICSNRCIAMARVSKTTDDDDDDQSVVPFWILEGSEANGKRR